MSTPRSPRGRVRDVLPKLRLGRWPIGASNSLTDVPGVLVSTHSIQPDQSVNTGVTAIVPRGDWSEYSSFAGVFSFNGCGELTGSHWINETGLLTSPIILTSTGAIGDAYKGIYEYLFKHHAKDGEVELFVFPTIGETFDGFLNDLSRFAVTPGHIIKAIEEATNDPVKEGNTGGGTGMICHRYKGGTGSSSRLIAGFDNKGNPKTYTVAALVQANYGAAETLHVGGIPVGAILKEQNAPIPIKEADADTKEARKDGSIIIVIATDAPLLPVQLQRLAKRATVGLGKVGGYGGNSSGDIFLAFSTGNKVPIQELSFAGSGQTQERTPYTPVPHGVEMCDNTTMNGLFEGAADATEEAILNCLFMAESITGFKGRSVDALDLDKVKEIVNPRI